MIETTNSAAGTAEEIRIHRVLTTAYQRERTGEIHSPEPMTVRDIFEQAPGDGEEEMRIKTETTRRLINFLFQDGPHPGHTLRLLYLLTQQIAPEQILNMNGSELADIFGETRAAWSARVKRIFNNYLSKAGAKGFKSRTQRSETARAAYAAGARGNTNRRGT